MMKKNVYQHGKNENVYQHDENVEQRKGDDGVNGDAKRIRRRKNEHRRVGLKVRLTCLSKC